MFVYIYCLLAFALTLANIFVGDTNSFFSLINSFFYWLFLPCLIIFWFEQIFFEKEESFARKLLYLLTAFWGFYYVWFPFYSIPKAEEFKARSFEIMTFNLFYKNQDYFRISKMIKNSDPDIICLQETTPRAARELKRKLKSRYQYFSFQNKNSIFGSQIISKYPLSEIKNTKIQEDILFSRINFKGKDFYLVNIHTNSIDPFDIFANQEKIQKAYQKRLQSLNKVFDFLESKKIDLNKTIILGDFNSTEGNDFYKLLKKKGLKDTYRETNSLIFPWSSFTFPNNAKGLFGYSSKLFPVLKLDYIFAGKNFRTLKSYIIQSETGSDHKPVMANLIFE